MSITHLINDEEITLMQGVNGLFFCEESWIAMRKKHNNKQQTQTLQRRPTNVTFIKNRVCWQGSEGETLSFLLKNTLQIVLCVMIMSTKRNNSVIL